MSRHLDVEPIGSHIIWNNALFSSREGRQPSGDGFRGRTILGFSRLSPSITDKIELAVAMLVVSPEVAGKGVKYIGGWISEHRHEVITGTGSAILLGGAGYFASKLVNNVALQEMVKQAINRAPLPF